MDIPFVGFMAQLDLRLSRIRRFNFFYWPMGRLNFRDVYWEGAIVSGGPRGRAGVRVRGVVEKFSKYNIITDIR